MFLVPIMIMMDIRAGATVQLAIVLPELLKVMSVMVEPIIATWSAPAAFARLGGIVLPSDTLW
jgi:hypothetical protein